MNDEEPLHAHRHLCHLVGVRVIHLRPMLNERKFVSIGLTRRNVLLRDATDAVHSVRQDEAVPVNCGRLRELVRDQDADAIALHGFNRRARCLPVVTPAIDHHPGRKLPSHRLSDQVEFLDPTLHYPREGRSVGRDNGAVVNLSARDRGRLGGEQLCAAGDALGQR
jgi:hypothetical protein